jgi:type I restriction enzyme S subunit
MTVINEQEKLCMPKGWELTELNKVVEINPESRDPTQNPNEKFSYIDIDSVENGSGVITTVKDLIGKDAPSRARRVIRTDDVIMSEVRPYLKAFALVPKKFNNQICSTGFAVLRSKGSINPNYLLNTLFSDAVIDQCNRMMVGAQYPALNDSQVKKIQIPLPPLPEQRRIATILTAVDDAIQRSQQAIAETERFKAGVMQALMTKGIGHTEFREDPDVGRVPKEWGIKKLEDICISNAFGPRFSGSLYSPEGNVAVLRTTDLDPEGNISYEQMPRANLELNDFKGHFLQPNDLVITRSGTCGIAAIFSGYKVPVLPGAFLIRFRLSADTNSQFVKIYINSSFGKKQIAKLERGGVQKNLTGSALLKIKFPFPTSSEQNRIISVITTIDNKLTLQHKRKLLLEQLKQGLMNDLLTGRRRVKVA